jgi:hypothetical protein
MQHPLEPVSVMVETSADPVPRLITATEAAGGKIENLQGAMLAGNQMPTTTHNNNVVQYGYWPLEAPHGNRRVRVRLSLGQLNLANGQMFTLNSVTYYLDGSVAYVNNINKSLFLGSEAEKDFSSFERYRVLSAHLQYASSMASTVNGSIKFFVDPDPADPYSVGTTVSPGLLESHRPEKVFVWENSELRAMRTQTQSLWTDEAISTFTMFGTGTNGAGSNTSTSDVRLTDAGTIVVTAGDSCIATGTGAITLIGELLLDITLEFSGAQMSDLGNFVFCAKFGSNNAAAGAGQIASAYNNVALDPFATVCSQQSLVGNGGQFEVASNPYYYPNNVTQVSGVTPTSPIPNGTLYLPYGTYIWAAVYGMAVGAQTNISASASFSLPTGMLYSSNCYASIETSETGVVPYLEFVNKPTGTITGSNNTVTGYGIIRIPYNIGLNARVAVTLRMTIAWTGSTIPSTYMTTYMLRVPTFDNLPNAMVFPKGNSSGIIDYSLAERVYQLYQLTDDPDEKAALLARHERLTSGLVCQRDRRLKQLRDYIADADARDEKTHYVSETSNGGVTPEPVLIEHDQLQSRDLSNSMTAAAIKAFTSAITRR